MATPARRALAPLLAALLLISAHAAEARERGADGEFSERRSSHFVLLQDVAIDEYTGASGSRRFERDVLSVLEEAHDQVRRVLGVSPRSPVRVVIYDSDVFEREFGGIFRFRAAGFYNGAIHLRAGTSVTASLTRTLHHEYTHAVLDSMAPRGTFPGWLNEGLAEYFEHRVAGRRGLARGELSHLKEALAEGRWIPLHELDSPSFGHLDPESATLAYLESLAAVTYLVDARGEDALERLCKQLVRSGVLDRALARVYRLDLAKLESGLVAKLR